MKTSPDLETAPRVPLRIVAASIVGLWVCYFLLTTARGFVVGLEWEQDLLWRRGVVSAFGIIVTFGMWMIVRLFDHKPLWTKIVAALLIALPCSVAIAQVNQWMFASVEAKAIKEMGKKQGLNLRRDDAGNVLMDVPYWGNGSTEVPPEAKGPDGEWQGPSTTITLAPAPTGLERWRRLTDLALGRYYLLLAWASLYLALLAGAQAKAAADREAKFRRAAKAAELRSLRYQVNPHFLFNTLNSLSALVMTGRTDDAEEMIQTISRFYRHSLADDPTSDVPLEEEFALQELYLEIEGVRFPRRLRVNFDLPQELKRLRVPGMILQPIVENSVKYAVSASTEPVTISVVAREEYERLVITVSDNGGPASSKTKTHGFGIGLANVRDRLAARFGNAASIVSGPTLDGYETELRIPLRTGDG